MADSAIQPDVEQEAAQEAADQPAELQEEEQPKLSPREEMMNTLTEKRKLQRDEEQGEFGDEEQGDPDPDPDSAEKEGDSDELVMLKVNGREIFRTKQEVEDAGGVPAIQKKIAGDLKLEDAARENKRLKDEREQFERERKEWEKQKAVQPAAVQQKTVTDDVKTRAAKIAEDLFLGDTSSMAAALEVVLTNGQQVPQHIQQQSVDPAQLSDRVAKAVDERVFEIEKEKAREEFAKNFKDIYENPILKDYANKQTVELMRENPTWGPAKIMAEAGKRTRAAMPQQSSKIESKEQRKHDAAHRVDHAGARKSNPPKIEPVPKTRRQTFEELSAKRVR